MGSPDGRTDVRPFRPARGLRAGEVACLEVATGKRAGELIVLGEGTSMVGRGPSAEIRLDDDGVSRHHAKLAVGSDGSITVLDLQSTNGTFVNRAQVERAAVRENDVLQIGPDVRMRLCYRREDEIARIAPRRDEPAHAPKLTKRELEVARMAAQGLTNAEIGERLSISPRTVNSHLTKIYDRLDVHSRAALAMWLVESGLAKGGTG